MSEPFVDVLIVGAGLSGVGAACHLEQQCPGKSYLLLEGRESMGGTWDLFRYPGVRSDSDMYTLGYEFKPWREAKAIADGPSILRYVKEAAAEHGVDQHVRYQHRVKKASWSTEDATWTVESERSDSGETARFRCNFLLLCAGYYRYDHGHEPNFEGRERFQGQVVHPQFWPEDLDYRDQQVVVIGSGATAMTLVPEMAKNAREVVMLQRSPTYVVARPDQDAIANLLRKLLPESWAYRLIRLKNTAFQQFLYRRTRTQPDKVKKLLLDGVKKELGPDYDIETHFTPRYDPWDQRLCLVPNGDLFQAIRSGKASVVTDHIETFTENGIRLQSGRELEADIIVTATGLELELLGGVELLVDGRSIELADTYTYKGLMYSGVPNLVNTFGYINASWTLRADLTADYACRLLNHLDETGLRQCTPRLRAEDHVTATRPYIDDFSSGYMRREMHRFPKQLTRAPWTNPQDYGRDKKLIRDAPIEDGALVFDNPGGTSAILGTPSPQTEELAAPSA